MVSAVFTEHNIQNSKSIVKLFLTHYTREKNEELRDVLEYICKKKPELLDTYHFIFAGGTYNRLVLGTWTPSGEKEVVKVSDQTKKSLGSHITVLPPFKEGGIIMMSSLITQRKLSLLWSFLTPLTSHWLNPEDLALLRLCDVWRAKRLMNKGSVREWIDCEAELDRGRNNQAIPLRLDFQKIELHLKAKSDNKAWRIDPIIFQDEIQKARKNRRTIALISHDELKPRMVEFAVDHENDLIKFDRILTTGTTGRLIMDATSKLETKIHRYHSGPFGGDIEIATEVLFDLCETVVFFVDPLHPHPHIDDIRVVFGACMRKPKVRMLANEIQARDWMDRVVRTW